MLLNSGTAHRIRERHCLFAVLTSCVPVFAAVFAVARTFAVVAAYKEIVRSEDMGQLAVVPVDMVPAVAALVALVACSCSLAEQGMDIAAADSYTLFLSRVQVLLSL